MGAIDKIIKAKKRKEAEERAIKKIQLAQEMMAGTAKFAPGQKEAVLKALGMKKGGAVKKKKKSIMLKGRGGSFKGIR